MEAHTEQTPKRGRGRPKKAVTSQNEKLAYLETLRKQKKRIDYLNGQAVKLYKDNVQFGKKLEEAVGKIERANGYIADLDEKLKNAEKVIEANTKLIDLLETETKNQERIILLLSETLFLTNGGNI
jgi:predicted nuclease with TOPRIM domain